MKKDPVVGQRLFLDGVKREVFLAGDGRRYVLDGDGQPVHGIWILTELVLEETPVIVVGTANDLTMHRRSRVADVAVFA
jgi:hypothetical protein